MADGWRGCGGSMGGRASASCRDYWLTNRRRGGGYYGGSSACQRADEWRTERRSGGGHLAVIEVADGGPLAAR